MTATLERIDEALWLAEGETISFHGFAYPTRSVIVPLRGTGFGSGPRSG